MTSKPISAVLKEETAAAHTDAERHPLMGALARGTLPIELYVEHLKQFLVLHGALESALVRQRTAQPSGPIARVIHPEQFQSANLRSDLDVLAPGWLPAPAAPATASLIARLEVREQHDPVSLLGSWYVLEGSKNGASFLAKVVRRAYGLVEGRGDRYQNPYGDAQRERWAAWKHSIDALNLDARSETAIVDAAKEMFAGVAAIGCDVLHSAGATRVTEGVLHVGSKV